MGSEGKVLGGGGEAWGGRGEVWEVGVRREGSGVAKGNICVLSGRDPKGRKTGPERLLDFLMEAWFPRVSRR